MTKLLRAAVIGAGSMGRNHARVYAEMDDAELVAVADPDQESLNKIAQRHRVRRPGGRAAAQTATTAEGAADAAGQAARPGGSAEDA